MRIAQIRNEWSAETIVQERVSIEIVFSSFHLLTCSFSNAMLKCNKNKARNTQIPASHSAVRSHCVSMYALKLEISAKQNRKIQNWNSFEFV